MKTIDLIKEGYKQLTNEKIINEFDGFYDCDLLSFVMGHAKTGQVLLTIINNMNTIGVASLLELPAIIFCEGVIPSNDMIEKANEEGIVLITSKKTKTEIILELAK